MIDTSTEFCERLAHDCELGRKALGSTFQSGQAILGDCAKTLKMVAAERDALRAALKQIAEGRFSLAPAPDYVTNPTPSPQDIASAALNEIARAV